MDSYLAEGYVPKITPVEESNCKLDRIWYLPTFIVQNPNKPYKVRLVWDAAAKVDGISLNSCLLKGPDMISSLPGILYRFRERRVALTGDIREMFHQVQIRSEDQNCQRFFWRFKPDEEPQTLVCNVMTFGATCSPACAQFIKNENANRFVEKYPKAVESILRNHYVDDLLDSFDNEDQAIEQARKIKFIHSEGGFEIRNWNSNSKSVLSALAEQNEQVKNLNLCTDNQEKVLGLWWVTNSDKFTYCLKYAKCNSDVLNGKVPPTKREMLRLLMSIYDPLGLLTHVLIYPRILMQEVWREGIQWDERLPEQLIEKWLMWIQQLRRLPKYKVPRCYMKSSYERVEMHTFTDASLTGYAAVCYFRFITGDHSKCVLVSAKSRVAPVKPVSVPRLELMAALTGVRLAHSVISAHTITICEKIFWTDSSTVLSWLKSDHRNYSQFVGFRVAEILQNSNGDEWRWVPGKDNPADLATKLRILPMSNNKKLFTGPDFLHEPKDNWPMRKNVKNTEEELRAKFKYNFCGHHIDIDSTVFSNWNRMVRTTAYALRFISNLKLKRKADKLLKCPLLMKELRESQKQLYKKAQADGYADEIAILENKDPKGIDKKSPIYRDLPFLDHEGVLRANSRLPEVPGIDKDIRFPILMPNDHPITDLLIMDYHSKYLHHNQETVLNEIMQSYEIPRLRSKLKALRKKCQKCKNLSAEPTVPVMSALPPERVSNFTRPFSFVGIDYFGPVMVSCRRSQVKRWVMLATCLTIRAIHLEVVHSLTTESCILALQSLFCRRGKSVKIFSDNATTFKGASNELKKTLEYVDKEKIAEKFTDSGTEWSFIPPASPHMGGAWERMVRSVKTTLSYAMPTRLPTDEVLLSMLAIAENIVNSRPLTAVPLDHESEAAITPNHFLLWSSDGSKPNAVLSDEGHALRSNWRKAERFGTMCFSKFVKSYLPTLRRRDKWWEDVPDVKEGDVVIVANEKDPKREWPKGLVIAVHPSRDGKIRKATVQMKGGIFERPVAKLAVLDVRKASGNPVDESPGIPGWSVNNVASEHVPPTQEN